MEQIIWPEPPQIGAGPIELVAPTWAYEDRYSGQTVIPHFLLGPYHLVRKQEFLAYYGVSHVLCIRDPSEVRFLREAQLPGIEFHFMDVPADVSKENIIPHFTNANQWISQTLSQGGTVLLCCSDGINKSAAFVAAYLMNTFALTAQDAVTFVQNHRYCATPSASGYRIKLLEYEPICVAQRQFSAQPASAFSDDRNLRRRADEDADDISHSTSNGIAGFDPSDPSSRPIAGTPRKRIK
ncbi:hypothetical protein GGI12_000483 [Dipsacomyces acuminosporus]|nr:hypothetical protein GGI12_000483 [Dipsacomyces acuminosporus]